MNAKCYDELPTKPIITIASTVLKMSVPSDVAYAVGV